MVVMKLYLAIFFSDNGISDSEFGLPQTRVNIIS